MLVTIHKVGYTITHSYLAAKNFIYDKNLPRLGTIKLTLILFVCSARKAREGKVVGVRIPRPSFAPRPVVELWPSSSPVSSSPRAGSWNTANTLF